LCRGDPRPRGPGRGGGGAADGFRVSPALRRARPGGLPPLAHSGAHGSRTWRSRNRPPALASLGVALQAAEVEQDATLVADDPRVVSGRHVKDVSGAELALAAVVHPQRHLAGQDVAEMLDLARVGAGDRLHVLGPPPARLERAAADLVAADVDELDAPFAVGELAHLVRLVELLALQRRHIQSSPRAAYANRRAACN